MRGMELTPGLEEACLGAQFLSPCVPMFLFCIYFEISARYSEKYLLILLVPYRRESVPGDQNLTFLCKIVPKAKLNKKKCK